MKWALLALVGCAPDLGPRSAAAFEGRCGECHEGIAAEVEQSRHGAADTELFAALREQAELQHGAAAFCDRCHAPPTGVCVTCHAAAGNRTPANGELVHDLTGPIRATAGSDGAPHATVEGSFLSDGALCGTCHDVVGFAGFEETPFATSGGARCQDCHMSPEPGHARADSTDHRFVGLQADAVGLIRTGVRLEPRHGGVDVHNLTPHTLPDGASWAREVWLNEIPLHAALFDGDMPVVNPLDADRTELRGLAPGEVRFVAGARVCVDYRPLNAALGASLGLDTPDRIEVGCADALE